MFIKKERRHNPSWELFLLLTRQHVLGIDATTAALKINENHDNGSFWPLLNKHRVELIAHSLLKNSMSERDVEFKKLQLNCYQHLFRALKQQQLLQYLNHKLREKNIKHTILKGIPLNQQLYGDKILRYSKDIDILVSKNDLLRVHFLLIQDGFILANPALEVLLTTKLTMLSFLYPDIGYIHTKDNVVLELHHCLTLTHNLGIHLEQNKENPFVLFFNKNYFVLSNEENFLYLCLHAAKHNWYRLQWLIDIAIFSKKMALDWEKIDALANQYDCVRPLLEAKMLLNCLFDIHLTVGGGSKLDRMCCTLRLKVITKRWEFPSDQHQNSYKYLDLVLFILMCSKLKLKIGYLRNLIMHKLFRVYARLA